MTPSPEEFYRNRIAEEAAAGEPELAHLASLIDRRGTTVDVGANQGIFAFALSDLSLRVHAFEAHPDYAAFARRMLGPRAVVHNVALSDTAGRAAFHVPIGEDGTELHLAGNLKNTHSQFAKQKIIDVEVRTLDSFALRDVAFIKVDVEGSELEVLEGGRETIERDRPVLLLELLSGTFSSPLETARAVCERYAYDAFVFHDGQHLDAFETIRALNSNTTWGSHIATRNVLFRAR